MELPGKPEETNFKNRASANRHRLIQGLADAVPQESPVENSLLDVALSTLINIAEPDPSHSVDTEFDVSSLQMGPDPMMLTWQDIRNATRSDNTIQQVFSLLRSGPPSDG